MEQDRLSNLILSHWKRHQPTMLLQFCLTNRLEKELTETAGQFSNLLHQLVSVEKMAYHQAWEIASHQFLTASELSSKKKPRSSRPAISASQTTHRIGARRSR